MSIQGGSAEGCCPICGIVVTPVSSLESHVTQHLDATNKPTEDTDPVAKHLNALEQGDAALARAIARAEGNEKVNGLDISNARETELTLRGGLADSAEEILPDVCARVDKYYRAVKCKGLKNVHLAWPTPDLFSSNSWGLGFDCGYRNIQILISSCLASDNPVAKRLAQIGIQEVPTVPEIQNHIEQAWKAGFDKPNAKQLGGVLQDTQTWIGANEVAALFRSWRLRACVVDFELPDDDARKRMLSWIYNYFDRRCKGGKERGPRRCYHCRRTKPFLKRHGAFTPCLFFQHHGHSRTIIGAEQTAQDQIRLLVVDPSRGFGKNLARAPNMSQLRYTINSKQLAEPRFQIVYLAHNVIIDSDEELEKLKVIINDTRPDSQRF